MFKIICFVVAVIGNNVLALTDKQKSQIMETLVTVGTQCINNHPVSFEDLVSFREKVFPESDNAGCFASCVFKTIGMFNDNGTLSHTSTLEIAKKVFEDEEEIKAIDDFVTLCSKVNDEDVGEGDQGCNRAKLAFNCYVDNCSKFEFDLQF